MNVKLWTAVTVLIVILAGTGVYLTNHQPETADRAEIIAMVNEDGSGIFASNEKAGLTLDVASAPLWNDLIIATPGPSSIQHMMIMSFITGVLGYKFVLAGTDSGHAAETVYYTAVAPAQMQEFLKEGKIQAGIAWEPIYSAIINDSSTHTYSVCDSKELWNAAGYSGDHPCCVLVANRAYVESHSNEVLRFLSAYVASVKWVNNAIDNGGEDYQKLVNYVKSYTVITNELTIGEALKNVRYVYSDTSLNADVVDMIKTYENLGLLKNTMSDMGFASEEAFADWLINYSYVNQAAGKTPADYSRLSDTLTLRVGVLANDVHQIALHVGIGEGIFAAYGVNVETGAPFSVGGDVVNAVLSGQLDIGLAGAPPTILNSVNNW